MIIKNGLSNMTVSAPKLMILSPTSRGNNAISPLSMYPTRRAIAVAITKMSVARINEVSSEETKNIIIGPNSIERFRISFFITCSL